MRIIAGTLGGRLFNSPNGHRTHPMSDKMRGAMFNILGDIKGLSVLDPFAGSGALSFEAVSRGAGLVTAIERDRKAQRTIAENIETLGLENQIVPITAHAKGWLNRHPNQTFDLILLDPPYDETQESLLEKIALRLEPGGRLVLSWPKDRRLPIFKLELLTSKNYGDGNLHVYQR